jgi:hypothetical protein
VADDISLRSRMLSGDVPLATRHQVRVQLALPN